MAAGKRSIAMVVVAALVIAAVITVILVLGDGRTRQGAAGEAADVEGARPVSDQRDEAGEAPEPDIVKEADVVDMQLDESVERAIDAIDDERPAQGAMWHLSWPENVYDVMDMKDYYLKAEYEKWLEMPCYADVRVEALAAAGRKLDGVDVKDAEAVLELADGELQAFWNKGGLVSSDAWMHGHLARAILETAREESPDNTDLLFGLTGAVLAMTPPIIYAEFDEVAPLLDRIKKDVLSGKIPVSESAMHAMYCWTMVNAKSGKDVFKAVPVLEWLVENAEKGGWLKKKEHFGIGLKHARMNQGFATNLWTPVGPSSLPSREHNPEWAIASVLGLRHLTLFYRLPKRYEQYLKPAWKDVEESR